MMTRPLAIRPVIRLAIHRGLGLLLGAAVAAPASAAVIEQRLLCEPSAPCHELHVDIELPSGRRAALSLRFEQVFFLTTASFAITAQEVSPDDAALAARLPAGVFVNPRFPLLFTIQRASGANTKFHGEWLLELSTEALDFEGETPTTRLYHAAHGGRFTDATATVGMGSFRAGAGGGDFSEFLLTTDLRPPRRLALTAYGELLQEIQDGAADGHLNPAAEAVLRDLAQSSLAAFTAGNVRAALDLLNELTTEVEERSGVGVLDVWDPSTGKVSRAGILRARAASLRLAVGLAGRPRNQALASVVRPLATPAGRRLEVILGFPRQVGDLLDGLEIRALDVDPKDPNLAARLPPGVSFPTAFPVLVRITPREGARPAFRGAYEIELRTRDLEFAASTRLRLFKGADGQPFEDITSALGLGSFRASGGGGDFSDFALLVDRRSPGELIAEKLDRLDGLVAGFSTQIAPAVHEQLTGLLAEARAAVEDEAWRTAIESMESFVGVVDDNAGAGIPDLFRAADARTNLAGRLTAGARSLQLSLTVQRNLRVVVAP